MPARRRTRPSRLRQEPEAVTWAREKAGLTKRALADLIGISEQLMGEIESGWRSSTSVNLAKIAEALNCPVVVVERKRRAELLPARKSPLTPTPRTGRPYSGAHHIQDDLVPCLTSRQDKQMAEPPTADRPHPRVLPRDVVPGKASRQENSTAGEATTYERRLRDLEARAFRTTRTLKEHSEQLAGIQDRRHTAFGSTGSPGEPAIPQQLDTVEHRLAAIEHVLCALASAQAVELKITD